MKVDVGFVQFTDMIHFSNSTVEDRLDVRQATSRQGKRFSMRYDYDLRMLEVYDSQNKVQFLVPDARIACLIVQPKETKKTQ